MNPPVVIDAGPVLNFCSINQERLLISVTGPLMAPDAVHTEVEQKAARDQRFAMSSKVWSRLLASEYLTILADDINNAALAKTTARISGMPLAQRSRQAKDLGELMVVSHAVTLCEAGTSVTVLIDDGNGRALAIAEAKRLAAMNQGGVGGARLYLMSTQDILERAIGSQYLPDRTTLRKLYERMRTLDDGLVPLADTGLLAGELLTLGFGAKIGWAAKMGGVGFKGVRGAHHATRWYHRTNSGIRRYIGVGRYTLKSRAGHYAFNTYTSLASFGSYRRSW